MQETSKWVMEEMVGTRAQGAQIHGPSSGLLLFVLTRGGVVEALWFSDKDRGLRWLRADEDEASAALVEGVNAMLQTGEVHFVTAECPDRC